MECRQLTLNRRSVFLGLTSTYTQCGLNFKPERPKKSSLVNQKVKYRRNVEQDPKVKRKQKNKFVIIHL